MSNQQFKLPIMANPHTQESQLCVMDITRYLLGLAKLNGEEKTGNPELSRGLQHLTKALRPYANYPISELTNILMRTKTTRFRKMASNGSKSILPSKLESIGHDNIDRILSDDSYAKRQIIELGAVRFGISRSKLNRLRKEDVRGAVLAALGHEKSLDVISREARRGSKAPDPTD